MGIVAKQCSAILISEEGRLALSGPEVIETVAGVEEFDAKDRALVWRVTGGKHRYLMGDCAMLVDDDIAAFRAGASEFLAGWQEPEPTVAHLRVAQQQLENRLAAYGSLRDGLQVWAALGVARPEKVSLLDRDSLVALKEGLPS
jgi:malonate decarboxylase beta subunit